MKRVVIVAPSFAPASNPPTHRVRFFAKHLPAFGWEPEVLATDPRYYEEPTDPDIERLIPPDLRVTRTLALPAGATRLIGIGDLGMRSYFHMRAELRRIAHSRRPDLLFIPGPPWHTFRLGPAIQKQFRIPYVIDYIDPWVNSMGADGRWWTKAFWFRQMALTLEPAVVRDASQIVAVSDGTNDMVRERYPEVPAERFTGIPYGFEESDFRLLGPSRPNPYWNERDGRIHLVYVGAMLPKAFGTLRALLNAVRTVEETAPMLASRLKLHFFGTTYEPDPKRGLVAPVAEELGLARYVDEHPARIPYLEALMVMTRADGILGLGSSERHYTASKIFPCILARRPLLAIYHEASTVCDIVREARAGELVTYSDAEPVERRVAAIAQAMRRLVEPGAYDPERVRWNHFEEYSAYEMTRRLAGVFERALSGGFPVSLAESMVGGAR